MKQTAHLGRVAARLGYLAVLALATVSDLEFSFDTSEVFARLEAALVPHYTPRGVIDAVRNLVLFAGWGGVWAVSSPTRQIGASLIPAVLTGAFVSLTVESLQLFSPVRNTNVLDVLTNTLGALGGVVTVRALIRIAGRLRLRPSYTGMPALFFAGPYLVTLAFEALAPSTRAETIPGVSGGPIPRMRAAIDLLDTGERALVPWLDFMLFLPLGILAVAALTERGVSRVRAAIYVALGGAAGCLIMEVARGFAALPIEFGAALVHAAAIATSAALAPPLLSWFSARCWGRPQALALASTYALLLVVWTWHPFDLQTNPAEILAQLSVARLMPLQAHGWRFDLFNVADVVRPFALFLPLGALLAVWPLRKRGALGYCWPAVYLALLLEVSQIAIEGRYLDGTDMLVSSAGAVIGWLILRHAGYRVQDGAMQPIRYDSRVSGGAIEIDGGHRVVSFSTRGAPGGLLEIGYDDVRSCEVLADGVTILKIARDEEASGDAPPANLEVWLPAQLRQRHAYKMSPDRIRRLDLRITCASQPASIFGVNFYYRQGNHRISRFSYEESVYHIAQWYGLFQAIIRPQARAPRTTPLTAERCKRGEGRA